MDCCSNNYIYKESEPTSSSRECTDCHTSKTPLWRGGPSGPKSLCNACGIRYRKKRRELMGLSLKDGVERKEKKRSGCEIKKMSVLDMMGFGRDVFLKQRSLLRLTRRKRLGEEEQAAVLLMALSSGLIYA